MTARRLVIVGDGETADIAYEYFTYDSDYEVVAFAVEEAYRKRDEHSGLPVVSFEEMERHYDPGHYDCYVAISFTRLNRVRRRLFLAAKAKGYRCATYVSSKAFKWRNVTVGENCFIFEGVILQHHARIGDGVTIWSGSVIDHRSVVGDHCFIATNVAVSGFCEIGPQSFLGAGCCLSDNVKIGQDCVIGAGAVVIKNTDDRKVYVGNPARAIRDSFEAFQVSEDE